MRAIASFGGVTYIGGDETILTDATMGARKWKVSTIGDCQALGLVGNTVIVGYHHNTDVPP